LRERGPGQEGHLHFATHALVDEQAVTRTALALVPGGGHDGFVGPGDLAGLPLRADLVVLSACRTARGRVAPAGAAHVPRRVRPTTLEACVVAPNGDERSRRVEHHPMNWAISSRRA
jgi:hypothetical protein